ncbi:hypothetical protein F3Y22_tig00110616pilonHSYRG00020 [Hibiscus syriacus]|uniref:Uncharacterized protein n=1 Tax=Hibiscus syriacus TaxID=106335 RepID=A0A6A3A318_HIBSY|nr:hypothetical protein F3Y22_tig00110616pilonHSYRG00020 [Hibiscus syriacus]
MATEQCVRPVEKKPDETSHGYHLNHGIHAAQHAESKAPSHGIRAPQHVAHGMDHGKKEKKMKDNKEKKEKKDKKEKEKEKKPEKNKEKKENHKKCKDDNNDSD